MRDIAIDNLRTVVNGCTDRAVRYLVDFKNSSLAGNEFAAAITSRPVAELLDLRDDNPVGWSFYFLKQIIHSINA